MDLLSRNHTNLEGWTKEGIQEAMPHLIISNLAMGEITASIAHTASVMGIPQMYIDLGSGTGATIAGVTLGLEKSKTLGASIDTSKIGIAGIEGTIPFFDKLDRFTPMAIDRINSLGISQGLSQRKILEPNDALKKATKLETEEGKKAKREKINHGEMTLIQDGIVEALEALDVSEEVAEGITVVTVNYTFNRLSTDMKDRVIKSLLQKCKNVILQIADQEADGSEPNLRYFNLNGIGLPNCSNQNNKLLFDSNGMKHFELNLETAPSSMDPELARRIGEGITSDAKFTVAYKGEKAEKIVENWRKNKK